jgi:2-polyprenyl-3-methyl-5-hydroxy-6-metoxy-1,4-benzoquinol methylase
MRAPGITAVALQAASASPVLRRVMQRLMPPRRPLDYDAAKWDAEYAGGGWAHLQSLVELARYQVVAGWCARLAPGGAVLDLGCGEGILVAPLRQAGYATYLGIDISAEAIGQAQSLGDERTQFRACGWDEFQPDRRFDAVILNETLYYAPNPAFLLERVAAWLTPEGILLVSLTTSGLRDGLMKLHLSELIGTKFHRIEQVALHGAGVIWRIEAGRMKGLPPGS